MKYALKLLLYAAGGFIVAYTVMFTDILNQINLDSRWLNMTVFVLAIITVVLSIIGYFQLKGTAKDEDMDEDLREQYKYRKFSDLSLATHSSIILSFLAMGLGVISEMPLWFVISSLVLFCLSFAFQIFTSKLPKQLYPERNLPEISDARYADKLLAVSDDGERHVMLNGLYKAFASTSALLFMSLVILMVYSVATGNAQIIGMLLIGSILLISNAQYVLSIRNKG
ncbi:DUF3169 family protein [Salinicoccus cyprini]|uniref:DUF3169 family protein n=1 Tax=Salinicoccus cyprini TaxID=2493691 RepID=A0A558AS20_9STAP|nr:DUF3169 family protein [Salinicoccus cyprini]TVT27067.1 DUF3169 family protein [Salinicoccus cyprini]